MHLDDTLPMPDSWEHPFFAAWDTAFHCPYVFSELLCPSLYHFPSRRTWSRSNLHLRPVSRFVSRSERAMLTSKSSRVLAMIDPEFAKKQLDLMTREWYMHPNGQLPAYEWNFSDGSYPSERFLPN